MATLWPVILACGGFWAVVQVIISYALERKREKDKAGQITREEFDLHTRALCGLLYGELRKRCTYFLEQGEISVDDLKELRKYYFEPYVASGGDGTIEGLFERVEELPIKKEV